MMPFNLKSDRQKFGIYLSILLLVYCLIRFLIVLSPWEDYFTHLPIEELIRSGENEGARAGLASIFMRGPKLPFWEYTTQPYGLGSLLVAFLTIPFYWLFGETLFAFKLLPICWHFLSVVLWYRLWASFYSLRKAFFISLFFVLAPPRITEYSLTSTGYHFETILWTVLGLLLFKNILEKRIPEGLGGFLLGLFGGFVTSLMFSNGIAILLMLIYIGLYQGVAFQKRNFFGMSLVGFLLGFSPWIFVNLQFYWDPNDLFFLEFFQKSFLNILEGFVALVWTWLRIFLGFRKLSHPFGVALSLMLVSVYLVSFIYLGLRLFKKDSFRKKPGLDIESFGFFYQLLFLILMIWGGTSMENYYLFPIVPFVGMTLGLALSSLGKRWQISFVLFWIGVSLWGNLSLVRWQELGKTLSMSAHSQYTHFASSLNSRFASNLGVLLGKSRLVLKDESPDWKKNFYEGIGFTIKTPEDIVMVLDFIQEAEAEFQPILFKRFKEAMENR